MTTILLTDTHGTRHSFSEQDRLYVLVDNVPLTRPVTEIHPRDIVVGVGRVVTVARLMPETIAP